MVLTGGSEHFPSRHKERDENHHEDGEHQDKEIGVRMIHEREFDIHPIEARNHRRDRHDDGDRRQEFHHDVEIV